MSKERLLEQPEVTDGINKFRPAPHEYFEFSIHRFVRLARKYSLPITSEVMYTISKMIREDRKVLY